MAPSLEDTALATSPIAKVPYDVLVDIFIHCIPDDPLYGSYQPNTAIAPMLLCQVCSSWRTVALSCPILWVHIAFIFTVEGIEIVEKDEDSRWTVSERDIEFIQWWKKNHGPIAPYLSLRAELKFKSEEFEISQENVLVVDQFDFLLEYISSAEYLDIGKLFWNQISRAIQRGSQITFPNLRTIARFREPASEEQDLRAIFCTSQMSIGHVQNRPPSLLRNLWLDGGRLPNSFVIPLHWATLTHIAFSNDVSISLRLWHSFVRSFPHLHWGYFKIDHRLEIAAYAKPSRFVMTQLETLSVAFQSSYIDIPINMLFDELHIPSLRTLSLTSYNESWKDQRALSQISTVLQTSTPNITSLLLGHEFLSLVDLAYNSINLPEDIEPFWRHTADLTNLNFEFPTGFSWTTSRMQKSLDIFIRNTFSADARWCDLMHPTCPIRTITLIDKRYDGVEDFVMSRIRKLNKTMPTIEFQITTESPNIKAEHLWEGWGSRY